MEFIITHQRDFLDSKVAILFSFLLTVRPFLCRRCHVGGEDKK